MTSSEIQLEVFDEQKPLNSEDKKDDMKKNNISKERKISFCSKLFFLWTLDMMLLSNKGQLKKDVIRKSTLFTSTKHKNELKDDFLFLKELWEGKDNKKGFNKWKFSPIIFTIARFNLISFMKIISMSFIAQGLKMSLLFFKRKIIKLFFNREKNKIENYTPGMFRLLLYKNISCFLIIEAARFVFNHQLKYTQRKVTRRTTSLLSLLIYEKFVIQKLLQTDMKEDDLINYFQTDTESMTSFFLQISKIIVYPFQFFTYFVILYKIFHVAFFFGISTLIILIVLSVVIQRLYINNQYNYLKEKDKRINFTSQTVKNIKELKLLQWEDTFKDVINKKRKKEMIFMRKRLNYSLSIITIHWIMPLLLCLSTIGAYVKINKRFLEIADLMTALEIFDSIRGPIVNLPDRIREVINAYVSMNRVANFLKIKINNNSNITKNFDEKYAINIVDAKIGTNDDNILLSINKLKIKKK
jgi:ABC-type multidrug transport system fused ATPase/permease subunit